MLVPDVLAALRDLAAAARARTRGQGDRRHRLGRQDRHQGGAAARARRKDGETHASVASYNNHWGVPLSLARCPASARYAVFEIGMNHAGEIAPLSRLVRPHVAIITTIAPVHLEFFGSLAKIADAKAEIFLGLEAGGAAVLNRDNRAIRAAQAPRQGGRRRAHRVVRRARKGRRAPDQMRAAADCSTVEAQILGTDLTYKIGAPGRHLVHQFARGAGDGRARRRRSRARRAGARRVQGRPPAAARRSRSSCPAARRSCIDESYNANPASMRAALALLGQTPIGPRGRRIAVLGDMLELGPQRPCAASRPRSSRSRQRASIWCSAAAR